MREPLEMVTASLMQIMVQICKKNIHFVTKLIFQNVGKVLLGLSASRSPTVGHKGYRQIEIEGMFFVGSGANGKPGNRSETYI